jgi:hypothetical protein
MTLTSSFTITLTETLSYSTATNAEVSIPMVAKASETVTMQVQLSSTQSWTTTTAQTVEISSTVSVPPLHGVTVDGIVNVATGVAIPIELTVIVSAECGGIALPNTAGPCTALIDLFWQQNPSWSGDAPVATTGGIEVTVKGKLSCSFGVTTDLVVTDNASASAALEKVSVARAAIAAKTAKA